MVDHVDAFERRAERGVPRGANAVWTAAADRTVPTYVEAPADERRPVPALSVAAIAAVLTILGALLLGGDPTGSGGDAVATDEVDPSLDTSPPDVRLECGSIEKITFDDGTAPAAVMPTPDDAVAAYAATDSRLAGHEGAVTPRDLGELLRSSVGAPGPHIGVVTSTSAVVAIGGEPVGLIDVADVGGGGYSVTMARLCHERLDGSLMAADSPSGDVLPTEGDPGVATGAATLGDANHFGVVHAIRPLGSGYVLEWERAGLRMSEDGPPVIEHLDLPLLEVFVDSRVVPSAIACAATCEPEAVDWPTLIAAHSDVPPDGMGRFPLMLEVVDGIVVDLQQIYVP